MINAAPLRLVFAAADPHDDTSTVQSVCVCVCVCMCVNMDSFHSE